ncbi:hypothetical protein KUTeg_004828 [Tegillarca granosa]|uniref:Uncharacterized protein n=1 Tax=Tegillarca granosa TaxID=220873 RepID=A0ABQ9FI13_TEGGR|nr:hypothetical protein KUTeg_004828 [Tegillarca granosa]
MIEIGAGTGIVGIVAATFGAHVRITDLSEFVSLMQMNIDANKKLITGSAIAECLVWGKTEVTSTYDYVLLADCIYYDESTKPLVDTIEKLCSKDTQVLCCYEHRTSPQKIDLQAKFFEVL